ncbi:UbiA prenyltransferase family protein [Marixanthomonas ophiurae]|uniref:Prenyltransferase n=1 Tax=Marixanthomonas ophiurae TaxID=387659 RepID=A0A3E1Q991_9FLAO|nr:hypothetical protein [Marixanthomonas ophiurae]RFN58701.1 hypothetical protein DZ858_01065 [Marixanthomonas ophiurae]
MTALKHIFEFYINSSIHVALAVISLVAITVFEFNLELSTIFWLFVFFGTITGYNFVKYAPIAALHHRSLAKSLKTIQVFSFICFGILGYVAMQLQFKTLLITGFFGALTVLYAIPVLQNKSLRKVKGLKIFVVAAVWAGVTVLVPLVHAGHSLNADVWITFIQRFFLVIVLTLPFEIRDLPYDDSVLGTLPQTLGVTGTNTLVAVLAGISFIIEGFKNDLFIAYAISLLFICLLASFVVFFVKKEQPKYYASFWVEGLPILWLAVFFLLGHFLP